MEATSSNKTQLFVNPTSTNKTTKDKIDEESSKGRFGWCDFEKTYIPYIFREAKKEKYVSVRIFEQKILNQYLRLLPDEVISCFTLYSFYITEAETRLFNEINLNHTNCYFGKTMFTVKDLIVRLKDATEVYDFLVLCHERLVKKQIGSEKRCGFVRIGEESVVPFVLCKSRKLMPYFYFEEVGPDLSLESMQIEGWDYVYLKFCFKVQGIIERLYESDKCKVVALDQIKDFFPTETTFQEYWPNQETWIIKTRMVASASWTIRPSTEPNIINNHLSNIPMQNKQTSIPLQELMEPTYEGRASVQQSNFNQATMLPSQNQPSSNNHTESNKRLRS